jgi:hypothetical protein
MTGIPASLPSKAESYEVARFNALKHGVLSHATVLPWETESEYDDLLEALIAEYKPQSPADEHLVCAPAHQLAKLVSKGSTRK